MARRKASLVGLGETELEVLQHVWALQEASVADVHERIRQHRPVAYTTVMTVMKNLADKGYLSARREGTRDCYRPLRSAASVRESVAQTLLDKVFGGSPVALVQALVQQENLRADDIEALRRLIDTLDDTRDGDAS